MPKFTVRVDQFTAHRANTLVGFVTITIPELHLRVTDLTVHQKNEARWVGLPGKPQLTREGQLRRDGRGRIAYSSVIEFTDSKTRQAFSARVIEALTEVFPDVFNPEAP
jgi:hypothetical protein